MPVLYGGGEENAFIRLYQTPLILAARSGHVGALRMLLEKDNNIESGQKNGVVALVWAAQEGREAAVQELLDKGVNIESKDNNGCSPLAIAARQGHELAIQILIDNGANIESKDDREYTPLTLASQQGHEAAMRMLLDKDANIEPRNCYGNSPLAAAAWTGYERAIKILLDKGANIESKDLKRNSPLALAAKENHEAAIRVLFDEGANIEAKNNKVAAQAGRESAVRVLLEKGANVGSKNNKGKSPLALATQKRHNGVIELLRRRGSASPERPSWFSTLGSLFRTPTHYSWTMSQRISGAFQNGLDRQTGFSGEEVQIHGDLALACLDQLKEDMMRPSNNSEVETESIHMEESEESGMHDSSRFRNHDSLKSEPATAQNPKDKTRASKLKVELSAKRDLLCFIEARINLMWGSLRAALEDSEWALGGMKKRWGPWYPKTLECASHNALLLALNSDVRKAETIDFDGYTPTDTEVKMFICRDSTENWNLLAAKAELKDAITTARTEFGRNVHPDILRCQSVLALAYHHCAESRQAEDLALCTLRRQSVIYNPRRSQKGFLLQKASQDEYKDPPVDALDFRYHLAQAVRWQGGIHDSEELLEKAAKRLRGVYEGRSDKLGIKHPATLCAKLELITTNYALGRWEDLDDSTQASGIHDVDISMEHNDQDISEINVKSFRPSSQDTWDLVTHHLLDIFRLHEAQHGSNVAEKKARFGADLSKPEV
ncbi:hypothetical protein SCUP515_02377 [Seiridium cupressi]